MRAADLPEPPLTMTLNLPVPRKIPRRPEKVSILSHFLYSIGFWKNGKLCYGLRLYRHTKVTPDHLRPLGYRWVTESQGQRAYSCSCPSRSLFVYNVG